MSSIIRWRRIVMGSSSCVMENAASSDAMLSQRAFLRNAGGTASNESKALATMDYRGAVSSKTTNGELTISCRNRHCPKCQGAAARTWMEEREAELLPVPYFHIVFTLPSAISDIA